MQPCEFSETQFSFCFTFEYIKRFLPYIPLPIFPNTVEEGRLGGGYDVAISGNIFFQFKIPQYHDLVSNFFRAHWNVFRHDYYKIKLDTNHKQFRLLKALKSHSSQVFYATPSFHSDVDMESHFRTNQVVANSSLFPIEQFPTPGSGHHHLIYSPRHSSAQLFSEPVSIEKAFAVDPREMSFQSSSNESIYSQALRIISVLANVADDVSGLENLASRTEVVRAVYGVLLTRYNVHWYPVIRLLE